MKKWAFSLVLLTLSTSAWAQTSILQDKSGESSLVLRDVGVVLNAGDASITLALARATQSFFYGATAKFKAEEGVAGVVKGNKLTPNLEFSIYSGKAILDDSKDGVSCSGYVGLRFNTAQLNTLNDTITNTLIKRQFNGPAIVIGINRLGSVPMWLGGLDNLKPSYTFGFSIAGGRYNNTGALETVDVYKVRNASAGNSALYDKTTAYSPGYQTGFQARVNADLFVFPQIGFKGKVGVGGYVRGQMLSDFKQTNAGVGIVVGKDGAPANINFGLFYQFQDIWQNQSKESGLFKRSGLNFVAGFSI